MTSQYSETSEMAKNLKKEKKNAPAKLQRILKIHLWFIYWLEKKYFPVSEENWLPTTEWTVFRDFQFHPIDAIPENPA